MKSAANELALISAYAIYPAVGLSDAECEKDFGLWNGLLRRSKQTLMSGPQSGTLCTTKWSRTRINIIVECFARANMASARAGINRWALQKSACHRKGRTSKNDIHSDLPRLQMGRLHVNHLPGYHKT